EWIGWRRGWMSSRGEGTGGAGGTDIPVWASSTVSSTDKSVCITRENSMTEPLITISLIIVAIAFNKPISDALLRIGDTMPKKDAITRNIGGPKLAPVFVSEDKPDQDVLLAMGTQVRFAVAENRCRPAWIVRCTAGYADLWVLGDPDDGPQFRQ